MQKKFKFGVIFLIAAVISSCDVNKEKAEETNTTTVEDLCLWQSVSHLKKENAVANSHQLSLCGDEKKEQASLLLFPQNLRVSSDEQGIVKLIFTLSPSLLRKREYISRHTEKQAWRLHYQLKVGKDKGVYPLIQDQADYKELQDQFIVFLPYEQLFLIAHQEKRNQLPILFDIWQEAGEKKGEQHQTGSFLIQLNDVDLTKPLNKNNVNEVTKQQEDSVKPQPETKKDSGAEEQKKGAHDAAKKAEEEEPSFDEAPLEPKPQGVEKEDAEQLGVEPKAEQQNPKEQTPLAEDLKADKQNAAAEQEEEPVAEQEPVEGLADKKDGEKQKNSEKKAARKAEKIKRQERAREAKQWLKDTIKDSAQNFQDIAEYQRKSARQEKPYQSYVKMNEEKINSLRKDDTIGIDMLNDSIERTRLGLVEEYKRLGRYLTTFDAIQGELNNKKTYLNNKKVLNFRNKLLAMDKLLKEERQKIVKKVRNLNKQTSKLKKLKNGNSIE